MIIIWFIVFQLPVSHWVLLLYSDIKYVILTNNLRTENDQRSVGEQAKLDEDHDVFVFLKMSKIRSIGKKVQD